MVRWLAWDADWALASVEGAWRLGDGRSEGGRDRSVGGWRVRSGETCILGRDVMGEEEGTVGRRETRAAVILRYLGSGRDNCSGRWQAIE